VFLSAWALAVFLLYPVERVITLKQWSGHTSLLFRGVYRSQNQITEVVPVPIILGCDGSQVLVL
jgi:hypothetical protein